MPASSVPPRPPPPVKDLNGDQNTTEARTSLGEPKRHKLKLPKDFGKFPVISSGGLVGESDLFCECSDRQWGSLSAEETFIQHFLHD